MKYLAILKDSLREAVDTWVIYLMLALSGVLMLVVASLSYQPLPCAEMKDNSLQFTIGPLEEAGRKDAPKRKSRFVLPGFSLFDSTHWLLKAVEPLEGYPDSPDSPLRFSILRYYPSPSQAAAALKSPEDVKAFIREHFATYEGWKLFEVTDIEAVSTGLPREVLFKVDTRPTPATRRAWPHEPVAFFGATPIPAMRMLPLGMEVWTIEDALVNNFGGWVALLVSVVLTAFFVPNMLRKGTVDLLLVKPISRSMLLIYKYIGGLMFILLNTTVAVGGVWLVLGLRSGIWSTGFLLSIFVLTFFFAILYSVSTLIGVLTQSPIVSILVTCLAWFAFWSVGTLYVLPDALRGARERQSVLDRQRTKNVESGPKTGAESPGPEAGSERATEPDPTWYKIVRVLHFVTPRTTDLKFLTSKLLLSDTLHGSDIDPNDLQTASFDWGECLTVNSIFIVVMLGLACLRFATRDY